MSLERLQKYLARCGVASRRQAEELIRAGRVAVNGLVMREMGIKVHPELDEICVDEHPVTLGVRLIYVALNKPIGVLSTVRDDRGRRTVVDLVSVINERIYPVGRLDYDSEGLILLTNDGELAARLMHPRYGVSKVYRVWVSGRPSRNVLDRLAYGVELTEGRTRPARVDVRRANASETELEFELREGRNRQIRRMCKAVGHEVLRLVRVRIGPLALGGLQPGEWRKLRANEVYALRHAAGLT